MFILTVEVFHSGYKVLFFSGPSTLTSNSWFLFGLPSLFRSSWCRFLLRVLTSLNPIRLCDVMLICITFPSIPSESALISKITVLDKRRSNHKKPPPRGWALNIIAFRATHPIHELVGGRSPSVKRALSAMGEAGACSRSLALRSGSIVANEVYPRRDYC